MKKLTLGTLLAALVASAILAGPGGAVKQTDSVSCDAGGTSTWTWAAGTLGITYYWVDGNNTQLAQGNISGIKSPGASSVDTTPAAAVYLFSTYLKRKDPSPVIRASCF